VSTVKELPVDLARLPGMTAAELETVWRRHLGGSPSARLPKSLVARLFAYRLQVQRSGDLSKQALGYLQRIASEIEAGENPEVPYPDNRRLKPGSVLVREHDGVQHRVMVLEDGYAWGGKTFASLSAAAKAITGTNWNGQRFFGLDKSKGKAG
jgi:hypothetical protein